MNTKRTLLALTLAGLSVSLFGQTSILIDFGKPELQSSAETDPNGYHWNNVVPEADAPNGRLGWEMLTAEEREAINPVIFLYYQDDLGLPYSILENMVDQTGSSTGVSLNLQMVEQRVPYDPLTDAGGFGRAGLEYGDDLGPIPTETGYPGSATIDSFYINVDYLATLHISGLDDSQTYTIKMWGGQGRDSRPAAWGVFDSELQIVETFNNTGANPSDYAVFENVSPVNGEIAVTYQQGILDGDFSAANGQWSTMEIIGEFNGGGATWYGYPVDDDGWANTGDWMGWVNVTYDPWIISLDLGGKYVYVADDSGWVYVPRP